MVDILNETLEDLKEQKNKELLYKYGKVFLVLVASILFVMIVKTWWDSRAHDVAQKEGAQFMDVTSSIKDGKVDIESLKGLMEGKSVYAALSGLNLALVQGYGGDWAKSAETYSKIANSDSNPAFKEYASLMSVVMGLTSEGLSSDDALKKLDDYINKKDPIFAYSAKEIKAALLLDTDKRDEARDVLQDLLKSNAPSAIKSRAYQMLLIATPNKQ